MEPGLGRRYAPDERDGAFRIAERAPETVEEVTWPRPWRYHPNHYLRLDQGQTGTCVAHSGVHAIENSPIVPAGTLDPFEVYRWLVLHDEWTDNDTEAQAPVENLQFGTSVRAFGRWMVARGFAAEYNWAYDVMTAARFILNKGPVLLGTWWKYSMFEYGFGEMIVVDDASGNAGGHAYKWDGVNLDAEYRVPGIGTGSFATRRGKGRIHNSWRGQEIGWMTFDDLDRLIKDEGEAMMAVELRKP